MSGTLDVEKLFLEKFTEKYQLNERDLKRAFSRFDKDKSGVCHPVVFFIILLTVNFNNWVIFQKFSLTLYLVNES